MFKNISIVVLAIVVSFEFILIQRAREANYIIGFNQARLRLEQSMNTLFFSRLEQEKFHKFIVCSVVHNLKETSIHAKYLRDNVYFQEKNYELEMSKSRNVAEKLIESEDVSTLCD